MSQPPANDPNYQPPQPVLPPITFAAGGSSDEIRQANLEAVLPSPGYPTTAFILADAITKRTETIAFDFSQNAVVVRFKIDGLWHQMPTLDRQTGDYMLATLKKLASLDYRERRARQEGYFKTSFGGVDYRCKLVSQGIKTGERVAVDFREANIENFTPEGLGMRPKLRDQLVQLMNQDHGLVVITSLPGDGLSTSWNTMLTASDRFMRDIVAIEDVDQQEPEIINVRSVTFDPQKNETPLTHLEKLLLKQPDALMFPQLPDGRALDRYCDLANVDKKMVFTRIHAKHSVDALFRLMVLKPTIEKLTEALSCVLYHRLIRLLCNNCKQPYPPNPALLQRLGILPGRLSNLYTHFQLRPEQAVDEKGQPIEVPPCHVCGGLGYFGRTGIFELLVINDEMREAMVEKPKMDQLMQIAKRSGQISLRDEGVVLVAKGATSVEELQRILKK